MFQVIESLSGLNFRQLMEVYCDTNLQDGNAKYSSLDAWQRILEAEQDQYAFLREFFKTPDAFVAVWAPEGTYKAALRMEPYADGFLLEGLETAPDSRGQGYAKNLIVSALDFLSDKGVHKVYSHVARSNIPSVKTHESCGFVKVCDYAVFVDGSVEQKVYTYEKDI